MSTTKLHQLKNLDSEVNDYHPILNELFSRMPNIESVEYTHGQNEMGADFVLCKNDTTLQRYEYIGVIVKIGKIKQNIQDIQRQIEECEIERKV